MNLMVSEQLQSIEQKIRLLAQRLSELERENSELKEINRQLRVQLEEKNRETSRPKIRNQAVSRGRSNNISAVDYVINGFHLPEERDKTEGIEKFF
jgi:regulator of replication initiation timing